MDFEADSYWGICAVCGAEGQCFAREQRAIRETYKCPFCKALLRERAQADAIISYFSGRSKSLSDFVQLEEARRMRVYEPGTIGSLRNYLRSIPHYTDSDYNPGDFRHQDLQELTFEDDSFDLVVTSDIFEHISDPFRAFSEIFRVLRKGGAHIFTVPLQYPLKRSSVRRVEMRNGHEVLLLPPHYHGDGKGGKSLVYTDFGEDILQDLERIGFECKFVSPDEASTIARRVITVVCWKK